MMTSDFDAFGIDRVHDREAASDGVSRFGFYVRDRAGDGGIFAGCFDGGFWDDPAARAAHFAAAAWQTATGPVMSPGYVRMHGRVLGARVHVSGWDGTLAGTVDLAAPWPAALAGSRDWRGGEWWRDWEQQSLIGGPAYFRGPDEQDAARCPYLLTTATLVFPLPPGGPVRDLPPAPDGPRDGLVAAAQAAAGVLVRAMNAVVTPVIEMIETGRSR